MKKAFVTLMTAALGCIMMGCGGGPAANNVNKPANTNVAVRNANTYPPVNTAVVNANVAKANEQPKTNDKDKGEARSKFVANAGAVTKAAAQDAGQEP